ncbi:sterol regulatory element-binding cleavage-activating -like, partial [Paramuricea clavata]
MYSIYMYSIHVGLSREGRSITLNLTTELLLLLCGYLTFVPAVQEFCMVGGVGVLTDFFLQIVFFATVLSIDLRRLEPPSKYLISPHVVIPDNPEQDTRDRQSPKKPEPRESNSWSDVLTYFYNPRKIFSFRQDLPKRLNFAYFWARTRIVQKGIMVFAIMYFIYIASITFINKEQDSPTTTKDMNANDTHQNVLTTNTPMSKEMFSPPNNPSGTTNEAVNYLSSVVTKEEDTLSNESQKHFPCKDEFKTEGLWRNLSLRHWPELLDIYGVNVMDRYISVLPPINLQYKVDNLYNLDPVSHDNESISKYYQDFSKDLRRTSLNYAVELAGFVKILYLITGIFIIVTVYLIYQLLSTRPRPPNFRKFKPNPKSIVLLTYPIFLDGHRKNIECLDCNANVIVSSCLEGTVRVWDSKTTECISVVERESRPSQIWSLHCWEDFVAMGCSNGDLEIWDFSKERMCFLYESDPCGVTAIRYISHSKILVVSRLNGALEFLELGDRLSHNVDTENVVLPSMRRKTHSNPSSWKTIINSVSHDQFPCHSRRAHSKTISVLATYKDLVVSGSYDNLLK